MHAVDRRHRPPQANIAILRLVGHSDELLLQRLNAFHYLLACDAIDPAKTAELFSTIVRELVCDSEHRGPFSQRYIISHI